MSDKQRSDQQGELFSIDEKGNRQDAGLHQELLGDDVMPWDIDLDAFSRMSEEERAAYMARRERLMAGTEDPA